MEDKIYGKSKDGTIEYRLLTPKYLKPTLELMRKSFYLHENVCKSCKVPENPEAISELEQLTINTAKDNVSVIAVEKSTGIPVGAAFNKIQTKSNEQTYFEKFVKTCKYTSSRELVQFMIDVDASCDLFQTYNVDCLLEIMFLSTLPQFRHRGIGEKLCLISLEIAKLLKTQNNLNPVPKGICAMFTSSISQKIGRKLQMEIVNKLTYDQFSYEGTKFSSVIGTDTPYTTLEFLKL